MLTNLVFFFKSIGHHFTIFFILFLQLEYSDVVRYLFGKIFSANYLLSGNVKIIQKSYMQIFKKFEMIHIHSVSLARFIASPNHIWSPAQDKNSILIVCSITFLLVFHP